MTTEALIQVNTLSHAYSDGRAALHAVSFQLQAEERVALIGPNGAGKTTLFLRLTGVLAGTPGQIHIAGLDPAIAEQRKQLPAYVGVVFQNPDDQLFSATVLEDVAFGPLNLNLSQADAIARAEDALARVGLLEARDRVPHKLSGGEKRRIALAGVLAMRPELLLLDEPSMYLDPRGRRELIELLRTLPGSMMIATHDLELVLDICPRVLLLSNGELIADRPARDMLSDEPLMLTHGLEVPPRLASGRFN